jgi:hypothetical protein
MKNIIFILMVLLIAIPLGVLAQSIEPGGEALLLSSVNMLNSQEEMAGNNALPDPSARMLGVQPGAERGEPVILFRISSGEKPEQLVRLAVYDLTGREVVLLVDDALEPDDYQVRWNGADSRGNPSPAGLYFTRLTVGDRIFIQKMTLSR